MQSNKGYIQSALLFVAALLAMPLTYFLFHCGPGGSGVLASLELPDGSEHKVSQSYNWSTEPYTVNFHMRSKGGNWGWCYIDHQAERWRDVSMTYDASADIIQVTESGTLRARLDRKGRVFSIHTSGVGRETAAPQLDTGQGAPFPP